MNQKKLFELLGAPLKNYRWSWGSIRSDQVIFLRVWQDETTTIQKKKFYKIADNIKNVPLSQLRLGNKERHQHIQLIENGCQVYMVVCTAKDENVSARRIKSCNTDFVFLGGTLYKDAENIWLEIQQQLPVQDLVLNLKREQLLPIQEKLPEASQLVLNEILEPVIEEPLEEHILELTSSSLEDFWTYISKEQFLEYKEKGISHSEANDICDSGFSIQAYFNDYSSLTLDGQIIEEFRGLAKMALADEDQFKKSNDESNTLSSNGTKKEVQYALVIGSGGYKYFWQLKIKGKFDINELSVTRNDFDVDFMGQKYDDLIDVEYESEPLELVEGFPDWSSVCVKSSDGEEFELDDCDCQEHTIELITTNLENTWMEISRKEFLKLKREGLEYADEITHLCDNGFSTQACYDNTSALFVDGEEIEEFHQIVKEAIAANNQSEASTKNTSTTTSTSKKKKVKYALVVASGGSGCCWQLSFEGKFDISKLSVCINTFDVDFDGSKFSNLIDVEYDYESLEFEEGEPDWSSVCIKSSKGEEHELE